MCHIFSYQSASDCTEKDFQLGDVFEEDGVTENEDFRENLQEVDPSSTVTLYEDTKSEWLLTTELKNLGVL